MTSSSVALALTAPSRTRIGAAWGKYAALVAMSFRQRLADRAVLAGRIAFYFIILMVFARLWEAVLSEGAAGKHGNAWTDYVWYLAVTEWIMLSLPQLYVDIESDVRSGDIAYLLARPVSYVGSKLAEGVGDMLLRFLTLGVAGVAFARAFGGGWPSSVSGLLLAVPLGVLSGVVMLACLALIGLCAFWIVDCTAIYLIWQKLTFVLGGLMVPLSVYPGWLRELALHSPFSAMLYGPGRMVMAADPWLALAVTARLLAWGAVAGALLALLQRRARHIVEVNGG